MTIAKCSQCRIDIDDPGDDWDNENDMCLACLVSELQAERDELRALVAAFGDHPFGGLEWMDFVHNCCAYNRRKKGEATT